MQGALLMIVDKNTSTILGALFSWEFGKKYRTTLLFN
jgi:hypothetical protein